MAAWRAGSDRRGRGWLPAHVCPDQLHDEEGEQRDLSAREPARARRLHGLLTAWRREAGALIPRPDPDYLPPPPLSDVDPAEVRPLRI